MQEMVSQGPKVPLVLFMPSSYFKHKIEVTVADKLNFFLPRGRGQEEETGCSSVGFQPVKIFTPGPPPPPQYSKPSYAYVVYRISIFFYLFLQQF